MLGQAVQAAAEAGSRIRWLDVGIIGLLVKAAVDISREVLKARAEKSKARTARAEADIEEARSLGIAMIKDKEDRDNPGPGAFCPAHMEIIGKVAAFDNEFKHVDSTLQEIKGHVEAIRENMKK